MEGPQPAGADVSRSESGFFGTSSSETGWLYAVPFVVIGDERDDVEVVERGGGSDHDVKHCKQ